MNKTGYEKLTWEGLTKTYKKTAVSNIKTINIFAKKITERLKLDKELKNITH